MDRVFNAMLDRKRYRLDIEALRTLFGARESRQVRHRDSRGSGSCSRHLRGT